IKTEIGRPPDYRRHLNHVLSSTQPEFSRAFLNHLCDLSSRMRAWNKIQIGQDEMRSWLRGRKAMLYFTQPSSRTVQSFTVACQILGIEPSLVQDQQVTSSVKDEKELESIRTFSSYYDLIIMRSPISGLATQAAEYLDSTKRPIPVVNAGGGVMHHPTQALLDIYTLDREEKN
ncbi:MAG: aspartate carbamoyltransferase, partial [Candidatus Uhrbacteria bacterium]